MKRIHPLLERQIRRHIGNKEIIPPELVPFIQAVNDAYTQSDIDRTIVERSLEISSQELLQINAEMRAVFQALPDQYFRIDKEGHILDYKAAQLKPDGTTKVNRTGIGLDEFSRADVWHILRENVENVIRRQTVLIMDLSFNLDGTDFFYEARLVPIFKDQVIIILRDITAREEAIEENKKLYKQFLHAQKMEAIGTLAGGLAHDFNNLLMGIQGYISIVLYEMDTNNSAYKCLNNIENLVQKGAALTKQLLGLSKGGMHELKATKLNDLITDTVNMFGRTKKEIAIDTEFQKDLWAVDIDRGQIEQVLLNLLINAWQAMPGGGNLYLKTENVCLDKHPALVHGVAAGNYVMVTVKDTGTGMDDATKQKIFEPFFTTKPIGIGTGLGLASAYSIIKNHNGFIDVESALDKGTIFTIYFPASRHNISEEKKIQERLLPGHGGILLVDDEQTNLLILQDLLKAMGYSVFMASSGEESVSLYQEEHKRIDLVIMDMVMPGMGGSEAISALRKINPEVRIILCSGYGLNSETKAIMDKGGCAGFIQKPFTMETLSRKISEVLNRK